MRMYDTCIVATGQPSFLIFLKESIKDESGKAKLRVGQEESDFPEFRFATS